MSYTDTEIAKAIKTHDSIRENNISSIYGLMAGIEQFHVKVESVYIKHCSKIFVPYSILAYVLVR